MTDQRCGTQAMTPRMKNCPKCRSGELSVYHYDSGWRHVECSECDYMGPGEGSIRAAIRSHNERVSDTVRAKP